MLPGTVGPSVHCNQVGLNINSFPAMCVDIYMLCRSVIALRMSKFDLEYLAILIWKVGKKYFSQLMKSITHCMYICIHLKVACIQMTGLEKS